MQEQEKFWNLTQNGMTSDSVSALPKEFCERMQQFLGEDAERFFDSYQKERAYGLRYNSLKFSSKDAFESIISQIKEWELSQIPWCPEGYYYKSGQFPGKHPLHEAGAYYIQEPSAMSAVELLEPKPGEKICDLCAAPGGKTTQIAAKMKGEGLVIANEYYGNRAKILSQNVERMGIANTVVLNESPEHLTQGFSAFFDRILVDAPCSGEGMFRKDPQAVCEWSLQNVELCAKRQREILCCAAEMLKPGGVLVYSTCTFAPEENEQCIAWFLEKYPEFSLDHSIVGEQYFSSGRVQWIQEDRFQTNLEETGNKLDGTYRLWPHKLHGEGHFAARLVKTGVGMETCKEPSEIRIASLHNEEKQNRLGKKVDNTKEKEAYQLYLKFERNNLKIVLEEKIKGKLVLFSEQLYLLPVDMPDLKGWKTLRVGLHLGIYKKNRFEPSHALAMYLHSEEVRQYVECEEPLKYLHGETFSCDSALKGWVLVCTAGLPLGWGKATNGVVKNHYPKGLRICY